MRGSMVWLLGFAVTVAVGCNRGEQLRSVRTHTIYSEQLQKDMLVSVLLPPDYTPSGRYPVLYFFGDYGGGPGLVTQQLATDPAYIRLALGGNIAPLIIVGVLHDRSFMIETDVRSDQVTTSSGKTFGVGRYESYLIQEVIPFIERSFSTAVGRGGRYIGGYSLGGYAALRLGLTRPDLFSRVGGHSPTLFLDSLPDASVSAFLYPDEEVRNQRDPLRLVETIPETLGSEFYIDTGLTDVNRAACVLLAEKLRSRGVRCELHLNSGIHGRSYWMEHMVDYMAFYGRPPPSD